MPISDWKKTELARKKLAARKGTDLDASVKSLVQVLKHYTNDAHHPTSERKKAIRRALDVLSGELNVHNAGK